MRLFPPLYHRATIWSRHQRASWYLGGLGFAESSFFPLTPVALTFIGRYS